MTAHLRKHSVNRNIYCPMMVILVLFTCVFLVCFLINRISENAYGLYSVSLGGRFFVVVCLLFLNVVYFEDVCCPSLHWSWDGDLCK